MRKLIKLLIIFLAIPTFLISQSNLMVTDKITNGIYMNNKTYIFTDDTIRNKSDISNQEIYFLRKDKKMIRGVCDSIDHGGQDWVITHDTTIGGRHYNIGTFTINAGVTVNINATCHYMIIEAVNINVIGNINGVGAGDGGGGGGIYRGLWDSKYGTGQGILNCKDKDYCYQLKQLGGTGGAAGNGTGGGNAGSNGGDGTGFKQKCYNWDDAGGQVGGSGGGGGGAGGTYGGQGGAGGNGGAGGPEYGDNISDNDCEDDGYSVGAGGVGGVAVMVYGDTVNETIEWGSGGGGAGGGGRGAACYPSYNGTWQIYLYDSYGDGWDNAKVSVAVNGVNVLTNVTLSSGYGPAIYNFTVSEGHVVTITYTAGTYPSENYYYIYTNSGALYYSSSQPPLATYQFTVPTAPANRTCYSNGGIGGNGGGAVKLIASNNVTISGVINVSGTTGGNGGDGGENVYTSKCCDDWDSGDDERTYSGAGGGGGGAGGGAGGGVMIKVGNILTFSGNIIANGGNGGNGGKGGYSSRGYHGGRGTGGAGGGGGRIKVFLNPCKNHIITGSVSAVGGVGGSAGAYGSGTPTNGNNGNNGTINIKSIIGAIPTVDAGTNQSICIGQSITLGGSPTINGGLPPYNITWTPTTDLNNPNIQNPVANPTATTTYKIIVTDANNCTIVDSVTITVNPLPNVTITNTSPYCEGATIEINVSPSTFNYSWSGPNGFTSNSSNISIPNATISMSGIYSVTVTDDNGCSYSTPTNIVVNPIPTAVASNTGPYCEGATIQLLLATNGSNFAWAGPNSFTSSEQNPTIPNANPIHAGTYTVTVTSNGVGCINTSSTTIILTTAPILTVSNNGPYCPGETIELFATTNATSFSWIGPNGFTSNEQNPVIPNANISMAGTYTVTVTSTGVGCSASASTNVAINPAPTADASNTGPYCEGETIELNLTTNGTSFSWIGPANFTSNLQNPSIPNSNTDMSGIYTVTVTDNYNCTNSASTQVFVYAYPIVNINATDNEICKGEQITLTAESNIPNTTFLWNNGLNTQSILISPITNTIYYVTGSNEGCIDTSSIEIIVFDSPILNAYSTDESCAGGNDGTAWFIAYGGTPPYVVSWSNNSNIDTLLNLSPGMYIITLTDSNNCTDKDTAIVKPGVVDCYTPSIFVPNVFSPNGDGINDYIEIKGIGVKSINFTIYDRFGNEIFNTTDINLVWDGTYKGEPALVGDYTYVIKVIYHNGFKETISGHIYLVR